MTHTNTPHPEVSESAQRITELEGQLARAHADFINYRKDESRRAIEMTERAGERVVNDLLEGLDSVEALVAHTPEAVQTQFADWSKGLVLVRDQVRAVLMRHGVVEIPFQGVAFDPALHEAIGNDVVADVGQDGMITSCLRVGYTMHGRVLRPAQVRVGSFREQKKDKAVAQ
ncbi:MAG: nucleotide exchange factor GrpE [Patescibacteria group bacterium]